MRFGPVPTREAEGALLAHGLQAAGRTWRKGHRLTHEDVLALAVEGFAELVVARLDEDDVHEDEAAGRLARLLAGTGIEPRRASTGRANLHALHAGVLRVDAACIDEFNAVHADITVATLRPWAVVAGGEMVATVKIIPYAVPTKSLSAAERVAGGARHLAASALSVAAFRGLRVGLVMTRLPGTGDAELAKMRRSVADRLAPLQCSLAAEACVGHESGAVAAQLAAWAARGDLQLLLVSGAVAVVDRGDVVPLAIERAGGVVRHLGMPVDPGNLLVLGQLTSVGGSLLPVVGIPTCARSPKVNGFDWVLQRLAAGLDVGPAELRKMGVGGLLLGRGD